MNDTERLAMYAAASLTDDELRGQLRTFDQEIAEGMVWDKEDTALYQACRDEYARRTQRIWS